MDLRAFVKGAEQRRKIEELVKNGRFIYPPFIFADDLETGVGYEFNTSREDGGLIYWPNIPVELKGGMARYLTDPKEKGKFSEANQQLRETYDGFIDEICARVGNVSENTFCDIGCYSGYFPVSFSQRGAKDAVGYDREDFSECFQVLNSYLGAKARFVHEPYDQTTGTIKNCPSYDVVVSMMVLCHLSDVLNHLNFLGSISRKALFIWTLVTPDDNYSIMFEEPNKYFKNKKFPFCFDDRVRPSIKLLRKSLELMGFSHIYAIPNKGGTPRAFFGTQNVALLAMR